MKKFLLAFLFFISVTGMKISFGQTYHQFPDTLAEWYQESDWYFSDQWFRHGYVYSISHDTIINDKRYSLIGYNDTYYVFQNGPIPYPENYSYQLPGNIIGAIREDSTRKVWFRELDNTISQYCFPYQFLIDSDFLIYDFSVGLNDTLFWITGPQIVTAIDSIQLLNGEWRRRVLFSQFDTWIEGIGSVGGLLGAYTSFGGSGCFLNCFKERDTLLVESLSYVAVDCDRAYTGISDVTSQETISVFPNPACDVITFDIHDFLNEKFSIIIYSSNGQKVNHYSNPYSSPLKIPVSQLGADGLYFYTITSDDQRIFTGKFLVQR